MAYKTFLMVTNIYKKVRPLNPSIIAPLGTPEGLVSRDVWIRRGGYFPGLHPGISPADTAAAQSFVPTNKGYIICGRALRQNSSIEEDEVGIVERIADKSILHR